MSSPDTSDDLRFYDEDYLFFSAETTNAERTENELEFIWQALELRQGQTVLDLGCGHGRVANGLAKRGAILTGIDMLPLFLDRARADAAKAGVTVDYRQGDMRKLHGLADRIGPFDAVVFWFFSFGYHNDEENLAVLQAASRLLKPGGRLLIDQYNTTALARAADRSTVLDLGDSLMIQKPICDLETGRWGAERIVARNGTIRRSRFLCRCYSPNELRIMLAKAGFGSPTFLGDGFAPLGLDSTKQIMLATKPSD